MHKQIAALLAFGLSLAACQTNFTISKQNVTDPSQDLPEFPCDYAASGYVEPEAVSEDLLEATINYSFLLAVNSTENVTMCTPEEIQEAEFELSAFCIEPLNTSTNIALGYNATIVCADQASDELTVANLPVEAILSYNNNANYLVQNPNVTDIWLSGPVEAESESLSAYLNATAEYISEEEAAEEAAEEEAIEEFYEQLYGEDSGVAPAPAAVASTNSPSPASPAAASSSPTANTVQQALSSNPTGTVPSSGAGVRPIAVDSGR